LANVDAPIEENGRAGLIALRPGWPSMMRGYRQNLEAYAKKFRGEWYLCPSSR
jgi:acetyl-CoA synthetase